MDATGDIDHFFGGSHEDRNIFGVYNHLNVTTRFNAEATSSLNDIEYIKVSLSTQDAQYTGSATTTTSYTLTANPEILILTRAADNEIRIYNKAGALIGLSTSYTNGHADTNFQIEYVGSESDTGAATNGVIGEMGVYNKTLTASEASTLAAHLASKWSIS